MSAVVNVNGTISDARSATVLVFDHGFLFGEGVYETIRTCDRHPFLFDRHMRRLRASAARIDLECPLSDADCLARIEATMQAGLPSGDAYIRMLLTGLPAAHAPGVYMYKIRFCVISHATGL